MCLMVYMTAADREEAGRIAAVLVQEELAACVNIWGQIDAVYRWQGEVQSATEVAFVAKTTRACLEALIARVRALHSYELPCIVALPLELGEAGFLAWIRENSVRASLPK